MKKQPYIGMIPGHIKDGDDSRTDLLQALGIDGLEPMSIGNYNDGRNDPPIAAVVIDGKQYSLKKIIKAYNKAENDKEVAMINSFAAQDGLIPIWGNEFSSSVGSVRRDGDIVSIAGPTDYAPGTPITPVSEIAAVITGSLIKCQAVFFPDELPRYDLELDNNSEYKLTVDLLSGSVSIDPAVHAQVYVKAEFQGKVSGEDELVAKAVNAGSSNTFETGNSSTGWKGILFLYAPYGTYTNYKIRVRLEKVVANIPAAPTTDGTYSLKVTVADGAPTYSWVADEE